MSAGPGRGRLERQVMGEWGTFGVLDLESGAARMRLVTLEPRWRDNARGVSCIPEGVYPVAMKPWGKKEAYRLAAVPGRSGILIHSGNWAGDRELGHASNSRGCILVGLRRARVGGQPGIAESREAVRLLESFLWRMPWVLTIV